MIVDDERVIRKWLRVKLPWDELGFAVVGEYENGAAALEGIRKQAPDLLVTDVKMPLMDGIELIARIRAFDKTMKIVVISGFEDFAYARAAMKHGVRHYVLKPVDYQEIVGILGELKQEADERGAAVSQSLHLPYAGGLRAFAVKESFVRAAGTRGGRFFGLHLLPDCPDGGEPLRWLEEPDHKERIMDFARGLAPEPCELLPDREALWVMLVSPADEASFRTSALQAARAWLTQWNDGALFGHGGLSLTAGFYEFHPVWRDGAGACRETVVTDNVRFYNGRGAVYDLTGPGPVYDENLMRFPAFEKYAIDELLTCAPDALLELTHGLFRQLDEAASPHAREPAVGYFGQLLSLMLDKLNVPEDRFGAEMTQLRAEARRMDRLETWSELKQRVLAAVAAIGSILVELRARNKIDMEAVSRYIQSSVGKREVTLNEVAAYLCFSPKYFSYLFKQETGMNFIGFVTKIKLDKAKQYLTDTRMSATDIGLMLGFQDFKYFCKLFKKEVGVTPTQYRQTYSGGR